MGFEQSPPVAADSTSSASCTTGRWATHCPEARWARTVASQAGYVVERDTGSALIIEDEKHSFYFWASEAEDPDEREKALKEPA